MVTRACGVMNHVSRGGAEIAGRGVTKLDEPIGLGKTNKKGTAGTTDGAWKSQSNESLSFANPTSLLPQLFQLLLELLQTLSLPGRVLRLPFLQRAFLRLLRLALQRRPFR